MSTAIDSAEYFPSERDQAIYEAVQLDYRPIGEVAAEFGIATETVRSIALRTQQAFAAKWHEYSRLTDIDALAQHLAVLERHARLAMEEYHRSRQDLSVVTTTERGGELVRRTTVRPQYAQTRFMDKHHKILREIHVVRGLLRQAKFKAELSRQAEQIEAQLGPDAQVQVKIEDGKKTVTMSGRAASRPNCEEDLPELPPRTAPSPPNPARQRAAQATADPRTACSSLAQPLAPAAPTQPAAPPPLLGGRARSRQERRQRRAELARRHRELHSQRAKHSEAGAAGDAVAGI